MGWQIFAAAYTIFFFVGCGVVLCQAVWRPKR